MVVSSICFHNLKIMTPDKAVAKKAVSPVSSPKKKQGKGAVTRKDNAKKVPFVNNPIPSLTCYGFSDELPIEAYLFCKDDNTDAFYHGFKQFADGELDSEYLERINFTSYKARRRPQSNNVIMMQGTYRRYVLVRHVPAGISTPESRTKGLDTLREFLMSTANSKFPITNINTLDCTDKNNPLALDSFFLDDDIVDLIKTEFDAEDLNKEFYSKFPVLARILWSGPNYPDFARDIGFP